MSGAKVSVDKGFFRRKLRSLSLGAQCRVLHV